MPELPEVETIRRGLSRVIVGRKVVRFETKDEKVVRFEPKAIEGASILSVQRRAKILIINLSNYKSMLIHLKMTGQLIWESSDDVKEYCLKKNKSKTRVMGGHPSSEMISTLPNIHTRAIFYLDDDSVLFFNDLRRFAYMKLYDTVELEETSELKKIGIEPIKFEVDSLGEITSDFTVDYLIRRAARIPNRKIKQFITDQEIIAGVGNIYVDEALFYSGINPTRPVSSLSLTEWEKVRQSIVKALSLGIKFGGSSEDTYVDAFGKQGKMNEYVMVYRRTGLPCLNNCGGVIERIVLGGRGTHYCPNCQK